jgi:seryl-tRNA synthetase
MTDTTKLTKLEQEWREANQAMWAKQSEKTKYTEEQRSARSSPLHRAAEEMDDAIRAEAEKFDPAIKEASANVKTLMEKINAERTRLAEAKTPWHPVGTRVRRYRYLRASAPPIKTGDIGLVEIFGPGSAWPANVRSQPPHNTVGVRLLKSDGKPGKTFVRVSEFNRVDWRVEE